MTMPRDDDFEVTVRQAVPASAAPVWSYLLGEGLVIWLGDIAALPVTVGDTYATKDGVKGVIRSYSENYRLRLSWQPDDWPHDTQLQLTLREVAGVTTIGVHHERLANRDERRMMLGHWKNVTTSIAEHFAAPGARSN